MEIIRINTSCAYGERLYRVSIGTGLAWTQEFIVGAYNEQDAVDIVADYIEDKELRGLYADYYDLYDLCEAAETVDSYAEANGLTCAGNHGIYLTVVGIKEEPIMKTFKEAINIHCADIDITTGERIPHREIYTRAINLLGGLDAVIPYIPFALNKIQKALAKHDEHLNTLPLYTWDFGSERVKGLCHRKAGITYMSLSEGVCLLKEAARQWAERGY